MKQRLRRSHACVVHNMPENGMSYTGFVDTADWVHLKQWNVRGQMMCQLIAPILGFTRFVSNVRIFIPSCDVQSPLARMFWNIKHTRRPGPPFLVWKSFNCTINEGAFADLLFPSHSHDVRVFLQQSIGAYAEGHGRWMWSASDLVSGWFWWVLSQWFFMHTRYERKPCLSKSKSSPILEEERQYTVDMSPNCHWHPAPLWKHWGRPLLKNSSHIIIM